MSAQKACYHAFNLLGDWVLSHSCSMNCDDVNRWDRALGSNSSLRCNLELSSLVLCRWTISTPIFLSHAVAESCVDKLPNWVNHPNCFHIDSRRRSQPSCFTLHEDDDLKSAEIGPWPLPERGRNASKQAICAGLRVRSGSTIVSAVCLFYETHWKSPQHREGTDGMILPWFSFPEDELNLRKFQYRLSVDRHWEQRFELMLVQQISTHLCMRLKWELVVICYHDFSPRRVHLRVLIVIRMRSREIGKLWYMWKI